MKRLRLDGNNCVCPASGQKRGNPSGRVLLLLAAVALTPLARAADPNISDHIGIVDHLYDEYMKPIADAKIGWIRVDFNWTTFEPIKGTYDWSAFDAVTLFARYYGLKVYANIGYTPAWATSGPAISGVPTNVNDWTNAVTAIVNRYQGRVDNWGIWNEPNGANFWSGSQSEFINKILIPGADAIHAANPTAKVVAPELDNNRSGDRAWYRWTQAMVTQAGGKIDVLSQHFYPTSPSGGFSQITHQLNASTVFGSNPSLWGAAGQDPSLREVVTALGWNGPVWLTETGFPVGSLSEQQVAANYTGLLNDWFTVIPGQSWLDKIFAYNVQGDQPYNILNADGTGTPAYYAIKNFTESALPEPPGGWLVAIGGVGIWVLRLRTSKLARYRWP